MNSTHTSFPWALPAVGPPRNVRSLNYRLGRLALKYYGLWVGLVLLLAWLNCFWRLSSSVVSDLDEARYGVAASEMLRSHSALIATYAGRPEYWNLKPPLGYWMQELAFKALGPTVFAMRVPSALCALALIGLTLWTCRRWYGRRQALLAGLVLTSCFGFMSYHGARSGDLDSALSLISFVAMVQTPQLVQSAKARLLWAAMLSLGFLLKSFAILPFVLVTALYLLWSGDWRRTRWQQWVPAVVVLFGVVLGWILARARHDGSMYFVDRMFREDLFWRATRVLDDETVRPWGYLSVLTERFAPWPIVVLAALALGRRRHEPLQRASRLVLLWALVPLTVFSLARTQHHWYLDPTYPAWSMLAGVAATQLIGSTSERLRLATLGLVLLALLACEVRVLWRIGWTDRRPQNQVFLMSLKNHSDVPANALVYAGFPLAHSERFILEVVDGYRVVDAQTPAALAADNPQLLLLRWPHLGTLSPERANWRVMTDGRNYTLLERITPHAMPAVNRCCIPIERAGPATQGGPAPPEAP